MTWQLLDSCVGLDQVGYGYCFAYDDQQRFRTGICCRHTPDGLPQIAANILVTYHPGSPGKLESCLGVMSLRVVPQEQFAQYLNGDAQSPPPCQCIVSRGMWQKLRESATGDALRQSPQYRATTFSGQSFDGILYEISRDWRIHLKWPSTARNGHRTYRLVPHQAIFAIVHSPAQFFMVDEGWLGEEVGDGIFQDGNCTYLFPC